MVDREKFATEKQKEFSRLQESEKLRKLQIPFVIFGTVTLNSVIALLTHPEYSQDQKMLLSAIALWSSFVMNFVNLIYNLKEPKIELSEETIDMMLTMREKIKNMYKQK